GAEGAAARIAPSSKQVTVKSADAGALDVSIAAGTQSYPGITITPPGAVWDLSRFGHVEARVANTGTKQIQLSLRVDGADEPSRNPWNSEFEVIPPGQTKSVRVRWGYSFGHRGYMPNTAKIVRVLLFTGKAAADESFRVEAVEAGGLPGEKPPRPPEPLRTLPKEGFLLGGVAPLDAARQVESHAGVTAEPATGGLRLTFAAGAKPDASAQLKPPAGWWDLRPWTQVTVRARNVGTVPITLRARLESRPGKNDWVPTKSPIAPGAAEEIVLPFSGSSIWTGARSSGSQFASEEATAVAFSADSSSGAGSVLIESVRAARPVPELPDWLGKRPPVEGKWTQTLNENFDGSTIDPSHWAVVGENYYDRNSHFSPAQTSVSNGMAHLRFERKKGRENDQAKGPETDYATGFLTTFGKWKQQYGYFESRMKLPTAKGLWPAFWMMPDRGPESGANRRSTADGGMEFDIMEYLSRYGPNRYNIAMHWDGYGKDHKSTGTENIYVQPDKDGFITAGLLWLPGKAVYYCNGREIARWENPRIASVP
ncbi:MAG TPA: glycoside hydrolase family 16 protein, partial [Tepidisphaeraceae bacterium]|nr:glycoside hydrolase family 16 protein [Tepidisphaeraceae bacterium]